MQWIKSALFSFVFLPLLTVLVCVLGIPMLLTPRPVFMRLIKFWVISETWLEKHILGLTYEIKGNENLPQDGLYIVAAKHQSTYETFKLHVLFKDPAIILKKELLRIPLWGQYLAKSGVIAIDRSAARKAMDSVNDGAAQAAQSGRTLVIFPQGTRINPGTPASERPYKAGIFRIQQAANLPIIPLALNSGVFWPKGSLLKKAGTVTLEFLPPIPPGLSKQELMQKLEEQIELKSNELAEQAKVKN